MFSRLLCLGIALAVCIPTVQATAQTVRPLALHPENPHYFLWRGKPTIIVTSGEHYGALLNLDFDYRRYFAELQRHGLNHTRLFSGVYREVPGSFGITDNPLAPRPGRYICPWARSDQPGYYDGGNRFDLNRWDSAYFARLTDLMSEASKEGIVVEFNLFCPFYNDELWKASPMNAANNINGVGRCPRTEVYTLKHPDLLDVQLRFVRKVVRELRDFDNLYCEVCNEPYFGGVSMDWQHRIIKTIVDEERKLGTRHLISMNIANGRKKVENPHPDVSILNFHYCVPPDTVAMNYHLNRAIGENETGFRGKEDILYRTEGWDFMLAGGALYSNLDYSFTPSHPDGTFRDYASPGGGSPELRAQLGILKRFLESFEFVRMRPSNDALVSVSPDLTVYVLGDPGREYAVYMHVPLPVRPRNLAEYLRRDIKARLELRVPAGTYRVEWVSPSTGEKLASSATTAAGGRLVVSSPSFDNDIALAIRAEDTVERSDR